MSASRVSQQSGEGLLWGLSLILSIVLNGLIFFSFVTVSAWKNVVKRSAAQQQEQSQERVATIELVLPPASDPGAAAAPTPPAPAIPPPPPSFTRTSEEQASDRPESAAFIGERNTRATSDRAPDANAPAMPSQAGVDPKRDQIETTRSDFRDGVLGATGKPMPLNEPPAAAVEQPAPADPSLAPAPSTPTAETEDPLRTPLPEPEPEPAPKPPDAKVEEKSPDQKASDPTEAKLLQGPNPVDTPVRREAPQDAPKPTPEDRKREDPSTPTPETLYKKADEAIQKPRPKPRPGGPDPTLPGASTYQRKTRISGSISRMGASALDVMDSPLGRYNAQISRAVSLEWQRNNVRNRDLVTPGFLTVRFFINSKGKVTKFDFVEHAGVGEAQRGFTRKAVFDAAIPAMPADVKNDLGDEPLEITYNFYYQ